MPRPPDRATMSGARRLLSAPANWRVRTKLIAILAVPIIAILVNSSIEASTVLNSTRDVNRVRDLTELSRAATKLAGKLQKERNYTVGAVVNPQPGGGAGDTVLSMQAGTDEALREYLDAAAGRSGSFAPEAQDAVDSAEKRLSRLAGTRAAAQNAINADSVRSSYSALIDGLVQLVDLIPQGQDDVELTSTVTATHSLTQANELLAQQQTLVYGLLLLESDDTADAREFVFLDTSRDEALENFRRAASREQIAMYDETVKGADVQLTDDYAEMVLNRQPGQVIDLETEKWLQATTKTIDLNETAIESLFDDMSGRIDELRGDIQRGALLSGLLIVVILATALLAAMVVARSLVRPLLSLRTAALDVAGRRLPEAVRRLRDSSDQEISAEIETVGIDTNEEIGEVARAFDAVHREAVRLASEQAVLRNNVNAMFVNLSRRSQGLVERQLRLIDDLENREQDPDQLSNLFKLDHLATRMRRNNESLLVLAGTDTARRWTHPVPLNEVVLAAISEVEQYTRVKQVTAAGVSIAGNGVSDVVHLIAELLENATSYSPPATEVLVTSHSLGPGAGAMIEIEDRGIGMPAKDLERVNERLANPPVIDVSVSRTMGLFAVGRLAGRHGIRVQLRESAAGGITAVVRLPAKLVTGDSAGNFPARNAPANAFGARQIDEPTERIPRSRLPELNGSGTPGGGVPIADSGQMPMLPPATTGPISSNNGQLGTGRPGETRFTTPGDGVRRQTASNGPSTGGFGLESVAPRDPATGPIPTTGPHPATGPLPVSGAPTGPVERPQSPAAFTKDRGDGYGGRQADGFDTADRTMRAPAPTGQPPVSYSGPPSTIAPSRSSPPTGPVIRPRQDAPSQPGVTGTGPRETLRQPTADTGGHRIGGTRSPFEPLRDADPLEDPAFLRSLDSATERDTEREAEETESSPIFDSVSAWFQRRSPAPPPPTPERQPTVARSYPPPRPTEPAAPAGNGAGAGYGTRPSAAEPRTGPTAAPAQPSYPQQPPSFPQPQPQPAPQPHPQTGPRAVPTPASRPEAPVPAAAQAATVPAAQGTPQAPAAATRDGDTNGNGWSSVSDAGWRAAEAARKPATSGTTRSGLPVRVPMTHLVPGSAEPAPRRRPTETPTRSPEAVGGRLASFYQGVRQARDGGSDATSSPRRDAQEDR